MYARALVVPNRPEFSVGLPAHEGTEICERVDQNGLARIPVLGW